MRLRVTQVIEAAPGFPLYPGRVLDVPKLTSEMRGWVKSGRAEVMRDSVANSVASVEDAESLA
jgi:hypothetical protein